MMKNKVLRGVILVSIGASSYGMLATFVKMSYTEGYTTAEVAVAQIVLGILGVLLINLFQGIGKRDRTNKVGRKSILQLAAAGTSIGFTSVFYYLAVRYIPVSVCIVLLMQSVWFGIVIEAVITRKFPDRRKILAVIIILGGAVLATNVLQTDASLDWRGFVFGILAAMSFSATMYSANNVAKNLTPAQRSLYMLFGAAVVVFAFAYYSQVGDFNYLIFAKWGIALAIFGPIIPPMFLNAGFPLSGIGLGSIASAMELPVSIMMAYVLLNESVNQIQWMGVLLILLAIVIMNIKKL